MGKYANSHENTKVTIANTVDLCAGCGTCVAICPRGAISMQVKINEGVYIPLINQEKCTSCGFCLKICPGREIDFKMLNTTIFNKEPDNPYLGNVINCFAGYASDFDLRHSCASGGVVTTLLKFALKEKIIDGALVTRANVNDPLKPYSFIARTAEDITSAKTSRYCPVPVNVSVNEILSRKGSYAVVGLPCHIAGLRKAELVNKELKDRIKFRLCLVCNHTPSFLATQYLLKKIDKTEKDIREIRYRGKGWPGGMSVTYKNGKTDFINHLDFNYWGFVFQKFFWPRRCYLCDDKIGELGDASFMDPYLPEFKEERIGASLFLTRSGQVDELVRRAGEFGVLNFWPIKPEKIVISQSLPEVRQINTSRRSLFLLFRQHIPVFRGRENRSVSLTDLTRAAFNYSLVWLGNHSFKSIDHFCILWKTGIRIKGLIQDSRDLLVFKSRKP